MTEEQSENLTLKMLVKVLEGLAADKRTTPGLTTNEMVFSHFQQKYPLSEIEQLRNQIVFCGDCDHCLGFGNRDCEMCRDARIRAHGLERMVW